MTAARRITVYERCKFALELKRLKTPGLNQFEKDNQRLSAPHSPCLPYVGPCHVVSTEMAVAMAVPIENPADCEVRGVISDEILGYLGEDASSRVELFSCTTMHVRILPGRHKPCCVSNSIGTSSNILRIVRIWHRRTFSC